MQCFLAALDDLLVVGQEAVLLSSLEQLQIISGKGEALQVKGIPFPTLPPLSLTEVEWLQLCCSSGKGLTTDGFSDVWIRHTEHRELL